MKVWVVRPDLVGSSGDRLGAEVALAAALDHKNIVHTRDGGHDAGTHFVVTDEARGETLRQLIARRRGKPPFSLKGAINVVAHLCNAVAAAHKATVHGALCPALIVINKAGRVKIEGYALARSLPVGRATLEPADHAALAPELTADPGLADRRVDLYALGAILFELVTGRAAAETSSRPSVLVPGVPPELDTIIARCMARTPAERPDDALKLKAALYQILEARPSPSMNNMPAQKAAQPAVSAKIPIIKAKRSEKIDETEERFLVTKGKMDFGPFSLAQLREQITADQIVPGNLLIDNETGDRVAVEDHPVLGDLVHHHSQKRSDARRASAEDNLVKTEGRKGVALYGFIGAGVLGLAVVAYFIINKASEGKKASSTALSSLEDDAPPPTFKSKPTKAVGASAEEKAAAKTKKRKPRPSGGGGGDAESGPTDFDDSVTLDDNVGDEVLDGAVIDGKINGAAGRLARCLLDSSSRGEATSASVEFVIRGNGKVSGVKVNGETKSGLAKCINGKLRSINFPTFDGPLTRASFEMSL